LRQQPLVTPLPWTVWKDIVWDRHIEFPQIMASLGSMQSHADKPVDFAGEYVLVKKHEFEARVPLTSETDWARVYSAWSAGVLLLYPHRQQELIAYRRIVTDLFRAARPGIAIEFDDKIRSKYAQSPFRMDDRALLQPTMLELMFRPSSPTPPLKRSAVLCENWNLGWCESDPCPHGWLHGQCFNCRSPHCACDHEECHQGLLSQR
ncbi:hypothetical protein GGX14DRAFT_657013, partial [Mycena pura]